MFSNWNGRERAFACQTKTERKWTQYKVIVETHLDCQIDYFYTKNPNLDLVLRALEWKMLVYVLYDNFGIFYCHLVYVLYNI
jgi:hypothetical protein